MKTPDKIYLWETLIINGGYDPAWHKNSFNDSDVEYIRKDALLEWAENWKQLGQSEDFMYAIETLVQHLNSM